MTSKNIKYNNGKFNIELKNHREIIYTVAERKVQILNNKRQLIIHTETLKKEPTVGDFIKMIEEYE